MPNKNERWKCGQRHVPPTGQKCRNKIKQMEEVNSDGIFEHNGANANKKDARVLSQVLSEDSSSDSSDDGSRHYSWQSLMNEESD